MKKNGGTVLGVFPHVGKENKKTFSRETQFLLLLFRTHEYR